MGGEDGGAGGKAARRGTPLGPRGSNIRERPETAVQRTSVLGGMSVLPSVRLALPPPDQANFPAYRGRTPQGAHRARLPEPNRGTPDGPARPGRRIGAVPRPRCADRAAGP